MDVSRWLDVSAVLDASVADFWRENTTAWWLGGETMAVGGCWWIVEFKIKTDERKTAN